MISLINEARLIAGKPSMGFLNPFMYANPDIVLGSNNINRNGQPLPFGWEASKGWDPVTGLGTPMLAKLKAAALKTEKVVAAAGRRS